MNERIATERDKATGKQGEGLVCLCAGLPLALFSESITLVGFLQVQ